MKHYINLLISSIFPKHCAYCDKLIPGDKQICTDCEKNLPRIEGEICIKCGIEKSRCGCKGRENYFDAVVAPFYYEGKVRNGIHILKFRHSPENAPAFAEEMAKTVKSRYEGINFDFIASVPSTKTGIKNRGYDQVALLAGKLSELTKINYEKDLLKKIYSTPAQHGLPAVMRKGNLAGVFDVSNPDLVRDKTILLCDDISTSGETLNECAKMLWLYGAEKIYCVALAVTAPKKPKR